MTVGVFGGAFDPPHLGHVALAEEAIAHFGLDRLVIMVTGTPPHKPGGTDAGTRFRLAEAAFGGCPRTELSRHEIERGGLSYSVETVRWAAARWGDIVFLVGADEFADFRAWKDPDGVLRHARLGVATRPGYDRAVLERVLAGLRTPERVEFFSIPAVPASSSEIRERVARGEAIGDVVPPAVARLVEELGLYRPG